MDAQEKNPDAPFAQKTADGLPDWPDKHRDYWLGLASTCGADVKHARMAYALSCGMNQAASARFAGYRGHAATAGYQAARTKAVGTLLAMAEGDGWQSPNNFVSEEEKDKLLSQLMRSSDATTRLRAIEQHDKRLERQKEADRIAAEAGFGPHVISPCLAAALALDSGVAWQMDLELIRRSAAELVAKCERYVREGDTRLKANGHAEGATDAEATPFAGVVMSDGAEVTG
jgi:hypothetical protein